MLAEKVRSGQPVYGTMLRISRDPAVIDVAREAGLDFVMLDMEHSSYGFETLADLALAARGEDLGVLVRVPDLARSHVSRALDCGVDGVMVPMLETPEQARQLVAWAKYPPAGRRGLSSIGGHTRYRKTDDPVTAMAAANRDTLAIAQIETSTAVDNVGAIASTKGIDVLLIGPNDLAVSLGVPGQLDSDEEHVAIGKVAAAAREAGKVLGMHAGAPILKAWRGHGLRFLMNSMDVHILGEGFRRILADLR